MLTPKSYKNNNAWGGKLWLLTVDELRALSGGTVVTSINGDKRITGTKDTIDEDTRFGYTAWGIFIDQFTTEKTT